MRNARTASLSLHHTPDRLEDQGGTALFYAMSGMFLCLFAFVLWYCPRHL